MSEPTPEPDARPEYLCELRAWAGDQLAHDDRARQVSHLFDEWDAACEEADALRREVEELRAALASAVPLLECGLIHSAKENYLAGRALALRISAMLARAEGG